MNILFITLSNIDSLDERGIYTDLLREFKKEHLVYVMSPAERRRHRKTGIINGILKVKIGNIQKTNIVEKGLSTLMLERQFINAVKKYYKDVRFDVVMYSTPPITFANVISYIKKRDNAKSYLLLKDIFPQNAVDLRMFSKRSIFYRYFRHKEKKLYEISDYIGCMSQANVDYILAHNPELDKGAVHISPNCIEPVEQPKPNADARREIRQKYGIPTDVKVFIYGGNLGKPQDIPFVIECLKDNADKPDRFFVICGTGTEYRRLKEYIDSCRPRNILLINGLAKQDYEELVSVCDVGLIFLDKRFTIPNIPSRLLSYMQNGMPVIACTDTCTDIGAIITDGGFGGWCVSSSADGFTALVDAAVKQADAECGAAARRYLEENFSTRIQYNTIMRCLDGTV